MVTYFITFSCYGAHIHGDPEGSVDRQHNHYGAPLIESDPDRAAAEARLMKQSPYELDQLRRPAVLEAILQRCADRDWHTLAAHVRSTHVHVLVTADAEPEFVMTNLKSAASRRLNELGFDDASRKRWARHGSTRLLWNRESIQHAMTYVLEGQGAPMSTYCADRSC